MAAWRSAAQGLLHDHGIQPASELEAHVAQHSYVREPRRFVEPDGSCISAVSDNRDHLLLARLRRGLQNGIQEPAPDATPRVIGIEVHRILDGEPVSRAGAVLSCICEPYNAAVH